MGKIESTQNSGQVTGEPVVNEPILGEFAPHSYEDWKKAAEDLLKGRSFEKTLVTPTYEGFDLQPIYLAEALEATGHCGGIPGQGNLVRGSRLSGYLTAGWAVSQELSAPTPKQLNQILLESLQNGQNEAHIWFDDATRRGVDVDQARPGSAGVCGLSLSSSVDFGTLFAGVHLDAISLYLRGGMAAPALYAQFMAWAQSSGVDTGKLTGCIGFDPAAWLVEKGELPIGQDAALDAMAAMVRHAGQVAPQLQVIEVQGHAYHNGGASSAQEVAAVLATAFSYVKAMQERGLAVADVIGKIRFAVSIGGNYFIEIAKLRALRLLWSRILEAFGVAADQRTMNVHARTGLYNKTLFDPYVNMLRTTTEAFSAVVGGCDGLHIGPFDEILRESDTFSRRIARNTHAILAEECGMSQVVDPSGGSWAVETLTDQLAAKAWQLLQEIEASGGIWASLTSGKLQAQIEAVRDERAKNVQRRKDIIVGTNNYPNSTETLLKGGSIDYKAALAQRMEDLKLARTNRDGVGIAAALAGAGGDADALLAGWLQAAKAGATLGELTATWPTGGQGLQAQPIALRRAAEDFETLRLTAMAMRESGQPPRLLQLNMGPSRRYRARADWTSAFFQVGGLEVMNDADFADADAALQALAQSHARVAIITSDDETYASLVEPLAKALKAAQPDLTLLVAGAPGDNEAAWRAAGVDDFVNVRVNAYAFNRKLLETLGAKFSA